MVLSELKHNNMSFVPPQIIRQFFDFSFKSSEKSVHVTFVLWTDVKWIWDYIYYYI